MGPENKQAQFSLADLPTYLPNTQQVTDEMMSNSMASSETHQNKNDIVVENTEPIVHISSSEAIATTDDNINHTEEPESKKICIQNTNIVLETEEDIQKWIEERRKRWPTKKNIEAKEKEKANSKSTNDNKRQLNEQSGPNKKTKRVCHFFQQHKKCKFGNKCKNSHELNNNTNSNASASRNLSASTATKRPENASHLVYKTINGIQVGIPQRFHNEFYGETNPSLFRMLVQKDHIEEEGDQIIKFIEYLDKRGLINHDVSI